jgi:hypothetical protein
LKFPQFVIAKAARARKSNGIEPKLRRCPVPPNMNMGGLMSVGRVEEKPVRANIPDAWHALRPFA